MGKKKKDKKIDSKLVRSINKNVMSSTRKLKPILKSIVGKKVDVAIRDLTFSEKNRLCARCGKGRHFPDFTHFANRDGRLPIFSPTEMATSAFSAGN